MATLHRDTTHAVKIDGNWYELPEGEVVTINQLGIFERKFTVGDASADSDDYLSSLIMRDFSGGIGIEDSDEGADTTRFWFGVIDSRSPRMLAPPPKVTQVAGPQAGSPYPIGVVGTQFYMAFDDDAYGWNDTGNAWHVTANDVGTAPVNKSVAFDGRVWIPRGSSGITYVTESNASNGTLAITTAATPEAVALAVWNNVLYALASDGDLWKLVVGTTTWGPVENSALTQLRLNQSDAPKNLVTYFDRSGAPTLWAVSDRSAYMFNESAVEWRQSNIQFPPHPDFGRSVAVWRPGEDLWIAAATDVVRQTTGNSVVPLSSGLSRDQGLPQQYRGVIKDLIPEISHLYALVGGVLDVSTGYLYSATTGTTGTGNGQFKYPRGIAVDGSGNVFVCDSFNFRIQKFNSSLVYQAQAGSSGTGDGQFGTNGPHDIAMDASGNFYVTDLTNDRVQKFNSSLVYQSQFGSAGTGDGQFSDPVGIAINLTTGGIYVTDVGNSRIQYFTSSGVYSGKWGSAGSGPGQFGSTSLSLDINQTTGDVYVTDVTNDRVQQFTSAGVFIRTWGTSGSGDGQFQFPRAIAIHPVTGNVFVSDATRGDVQEFTSAGVFVRKFGSVGTGSGQFTDCRGLAFDSTGAALYASDLNITPTSNPQRIQKFTSSSAGQLNAYPTLMAWTGTGWHCLWAKTVTDYVPTAGAISAPTTHYRLWWGMSDEDAYYLDLRRTFYNPLQGFRAGIDHFTDGWLLTSKFDAGMLGFDKVASHMTIFPHSATTAETITIEYSIDDGGWELLGVVDETREWNFMFGTGGVGRVFNTIQFRFSLKGGVSVDTLAALLKAATLLFIKVPQNARSQVFPIILPKQEKHPWGSARAQSDRLDALNSSNEFFDIEYGGRTYEHCRIAGITGYDQTSDGGGQRNVNIIWIPVEAD